MRRKGNIIATAMLAAGVLIFTGAASNSCDDPQTSGTHHGKHYQIKVCVDKHSHPCKRHKK